MPLITVNISERALGVYKRLSAKRTASSTITLILEEMDFDYQERQREIQDIRRQAKEENDRYLGLIE